MSDIDQGGFVYPAGQKVLGYDDILPAHPGITLRQHYAGLALPEVMAEYHQSLRNGDSDAYSGWRLDVAKEAFMMADAMIEAGKQ